MKKSEFMNRTKRLMILDNRLKKLEEIGNEIYPGLKIDWISFAEENLQVRYSKSGRRIKRVQRLYRQTKQEENKLIENLLSN